MPFPERATIGKPPVTTVAQVRETGTGLKEDLHPGHYPLLQDGVASFIQGKLSLLEVGKLSCAWFKFSFLIICSLYCF